CCISPRGAWSPPDLEQGVVSALATADFGTAGGEIDEEELAAIEARGELFQRRDVMELHEQRLRIAQAVLVEELRRLRMRRAARDADTVRARDRRREREPVDRRAALARGVDQVAVDGERERHLARYHEVGEDRISLTHREA